MIGGNDADIGFQLGSGTQNISLIRASASGGVRHVGTGHLTPVGIRRAGHRRNIFKIAASAVLTSRADPVLDLQNTVIWRGHVFSSFSGLNGPDSYSSFASIRDNFQPCNILFQQRMNRKPCIALRCLKNRLFLGPIHQ